MTKKEAIKKAFENTSYIGSHRYMVFEEMLNKYGYKIVKKKSKN